MCKCISDVAHVQFKRRQSTFNNSEVKNNVISKINLECDVRRKINYIYLG